MEENPFSNLNLTTNSVSMDDRKEISRVRLSESSVMVGVSDAETLKEVVNKDEIRVPDCGGNLLESLFMGSDVSVEESGGKSLIKATEVVLEEKTVGIQKEEVLNTREEVFLNDNLHEKQISMEETRSMKTDAASEILSEKRTSSSLGTDVDVGGNTSTRQDEKQDPVSQVAEMVSRKVDGDEKMDLHPVEENMNGVHVTVDSSLFTEDVRGAVRTIRAESKAEDGLCKQDENQITGFHGYDMDVSQDMYGVHVIISSSLVAEDINGAVKTIGAETKAENGLCKQGENQITGSDCYEMGVSQLSGDDTNFGSIVVDLGLCRNTDEDKNTRDEFVNPSEKTEVGSDFSVSDLVWGKVKSHPWWPGQIFDPQDSSKLAKKYQKYDRKRLLVAYFGDQTFAWNVASSLKPFQSHFSQMEKQTDMVDFRNAIDSALDEISRRVQLGLACSCTPDEAYADIKSQIIKNAGIRAESSIRDGMDKNLSATAFEPGKLFEYIKELALNPRGGGDRLKLVVAQAQLVAFYRSKGYSRMAEFGMYGGLLDNDAESPTLISKDVEEAPSDKRKLKSQDKLSGKRPKISDDNLNPVMKERSLSDLMGSSKSSSSGKKLKSIGYFSDDLEGKTSKQGLSQSSNEENEPQSPKSFKVGDSIRRVASQLKGSPPILNSSGGRSRKTAVKVDRSSDKLSEESIKRKTAIPKEYSDPDEMLSQLQLAARDPMKGYSFLTIIIGFFTDFRKSISLDDSSSRKRKVAQTKKSGGRSRKPAKSKAKSAETQHDKDTNDSYWTDMIIESSAEEQPSRKNQKRKGNSKFGTASKKDSETVELGKNLPSSPSLVIEEYSPTNESEDSFQLNAEESKQQDPEANPNFVTEEPVSSLNKNCADDASPTALILNFTRADSIPSETDLNKIFGRFWPLIESETEVLRNTCRAKVVFRSRSDAEIAFSSAGKFSIFGPDLSSYQLKYIPSTPSKTPSNPSTK